VVSADGPCAEVCVIVLCVGNKAPQIDYDKVPREITVRAGKDVEVEVPFAGRRC
jgi:hypothetical protein